MQASKTKLRLARPAPSAPTKACVGEDDDGRTPIIGDETAEPPRPTAAELRDEVLLLVYRQMHALAGRSQDLDDLVQIAAEQVFRSLGAFEGRSAPSTWTYRVCYHTLLKNRRFYQRWFRRFVHSDDVDAQQLPNANAPDVDQLLQQRERALRLRAALERVSPKRRAVVILHDLEELEVAEIADIVRANERTVRSRLRDGRRKLAELLENDPFFGVEACRTQTSRKEKP